MWKYLKESLCFFGPAPGFWWGGLLTGGILLSGGLASRFVIGFLHILHFLVVLVFNDVNLFIWLLLLGLFLLGISHFVILSESLATRTDFFCLILQSCGVSFGGFVSKLSRISRLGSSQTQIVYWLSATRIGLLILFNQKVMEMSLRSGTRVASIVVVLTHTLLCCNNLSRHFSVLHPSLVNLKERKFSFVV